MRRVLVFLLAAISSGVCLSAPQNTPQSPRQALIEMFFGKAAGTLVKHLPTATREAFEKSGTLANLQQYSTMMSQFQAQGGQNVQTFDTGSVLLSGENPKTGDKLEIIVESDALRGDQDDLELSFQLYKNGKQQPSPFNTQFTFSMKQEDQIWKLNEISMTIHLPLADPEFLKAITEKMKPQAAGLTITPQPAVSTPPAGSDAMVLAALRQILTAEATYAATYPTIGYTCTLSDLDGFGGGEPNEHQAMLINSGLASGKRYGFVFALSGCGRSPANSFRLTATPNANTLGRRAFCSDQSAVIRTSPDANPATCLASGTPIQ